MHGKDRWNSRMAHTLAGFRISEANSFSTCRYHCGRLDHRAVAAVPIMVTDGRYQSRSLMQGGLVFAAEALAKAGATKPAQNLGQIFP